MGKSARGVRGGLGSASEHYRPGPTDHGGAPEVNGAIFIKPPGTLSKAPGCHSPFRSNLAERNSQISDAFPFARRSGIWRCGPESGENRTSVWVARLQS